MKSLVDRASVKPFLDLPRNIKITCKDVESGVTCAIFFVLLIILDALTVLPLEWYSHRRAVQLAEERLHEEERDQNPDAHHEAQDDAELQHDTLQELQDELREVENEAQEMQDGVQDFQDELQELQNRARELQDQGLDMQGLLQELQNQARDVQAYPRALQNHVQVVHGLCQELPARLQELRNRNVGL